MNDQEFAELLDRERRARALGATQNAYKCAICKQTFLNWPIYYDAMRLSVYCDEHGFPPDHNDELWQAIPVHLRDGLRAYLMQYVRPGDYLLAVLRNDLLDAMRRAADTSAVFAVRSIALYLFACAPPKSYGDRDNVDHWLARPVKLRLERSIGSRAS